MGSSPVGDPNNVEVKRFFLSHLPLDWVPARRLDEGVPEMLGYYNLSATFPEFLGSLQALGAGEAVQYSRAEIAAYAVVVLQEQLATTRKGAEAAGDRLEGMLKTNASPARSQLKMLHAIGAVRAPRPVIGGRVMRSLYWPMSVS